MIRSKANEYLTLVKRLAILGGIGIGAFLLWRSCGQESSSDDFVIDDTPVMIENIRSILELNTINFRDEVVADSVEYYSNIAEQVSGNTEKLRRNFTFDYSHIRRRLTLIVKGELIYGFDLKKKLEVSQNDSTIFITLPQPQLLSTEITPAKTEIFTENGEWKDFERVALQKKAELKMIRSGERLKLKEKAKQPVEKLLQQLMRTSKKVVVKYE